MTELFPGFLCLGRSFSSLRPGAKRSSGFGLGEVDRVPQFLSRTSRDSGKERDHSLKSDFIRRVRNKFHKGSHILDMSLFEEPQTTGDRIRNARASQRQLYLQRLKMGPVKHRDFFEVYSFIAQLQDSLGDKHSLLIVIKQWHERRLQVSHFSVGP